MQSSIATLAASTARMPKPMAKPIQKKKKKKDAPKPREEPADDDQPEYPAPPCKFRANRTRMTLTIRITLHHIGASQINLRTSKKKIELDTLAARRKFKMSRVYPRGIECDDSATTATMEHNALVVEMPITKLPPVGAAAAAAAEPKKPKKRTLKAPVVGSDDDDDDDDDDEDS